MPDDFNCVLVRADRAVRAETVEYRAENGGVVKLEGFVVRNGVVGNVVDNADREVVLGGSRRHVVEHALRHRGGVVFRAERVSAAENDGVERAREETAVARFRNGGCDFLIERFAHRAEFLCPVENGDCLDRLGEGFRKHLDAERAEHSDRQNASLFAVFIEERRNFFGRFRAAAHEDYDLFGVGRAHILVGLVDSARELAEFFHLFGDDFRAFRVVGVARFPALEVYVGVLRRAADKRIFVSERAFAEFENLFFGNHLPYDVVGDGFVRVDFVRSAETVEEVQERNARFERGRVRDERHVVRFLNAVRAEHCKARLAACHYVGLVAENREAVVGERAGRNVHDKACEFARNLVHVRNHQQQTLRRREGGHQRACLERAVNRASNAAFALELAD